LTEVFIKPNSLASLLHPFKGQVTEQTTVKLSIQNKQVQN